MRRGGPAVEGSGSQDRKASGQDICHGLNSVPQDSHIAALPQDLRMRLYRAGVGGGQSLVRGDQDTDTQCWPREDTGEEAPASRHLDLRVRPPEVTPQPRGSAAPDRVHSCRRTRGGGGRGSEQPGPPPHQHPPRRPGHRFCLPNSRADSRHGLLHPDGAPRSEERRGRGRWADEGSRRTEILSLELFPEWFLNILTQHRFADKALSSEGSGQGCS